jgi:hypothetical protein
MNQFDEETAHKKLEEELLVTFPEFCDPVQLPVILSAKQMEMNSILGEPDIKSTLDNISREAAMPPTTFHDDKDYVTIRFAEEGVAFETDTAMPSGHKVNVREVVRGFRKAYKFINSNLADDLDNRPIMKFLEPKYMTLDVSDQGVSPALRFKRSVDGITDENIKRIQGIINFERYRINNPPRLMR